MRAHKIRYVERHRLMQPDEKRREVLKPEPLVLLNPVWLYHHPGVSSPEKRTAPLSAFDAAFRAVGM